MNVATRKSAATHRRLRGVERTESSPDSSRARRAIRIAARTPRTPNRTIDSMDDAYRSLEHSFGIVVDDVEGAVTEDAIRTGD